MNIVLRADGSAQRGTGHVMRCLSLAQAWPGKAIFAMAETTPGLTQRLQTEGFEIAGDNVIELARQHDAAWVVADGYHFDAAFQRQIKDAGLRLLLVDDYGHAEHYSADYILNQNLYASPRFYTDREPRTQLLLGTRYAMLRRQFNEWRTWQREIPAVARKVLVTLGGADADNVTGAVVEALREFDIELKVVVGGSNPHFADSSSVIRDAKNMPELMAWADVAISAGGTTSYELAFMGLPGLVFVLADNQRAVADALDAAGLAVKTTQESVADDLRALLGDAGRRAEMSGRGRQLVDGDGVNRVVACLRSASLTLRRVREEDCRQIWEWANEPAARAVSLSSEPIPWETHVQWFAARVNAPGHLFYLATNSHDALVGQIRYEVTGSEAVVSVSLAKEARGRGYGAALIVRGSEQCFTDAPVKLIRAFIKPDNATSVRAFERAGYADAGMAVERGQTVRQFVRERS